MVAALSPALCERGSGGLLPADMRTAVATTGMGASGENSSGRSRCDVRDVLDELYYGRYGR